MSLLCLISSSYLSSFEIAFFWFLVRVGHSLCVSFFFSIYISIHFSFAARLVSKEARRTHTSAARFVFYVFLGLIMKWMNKQAKIALLRLWNERDDLSCSGLCESYGRSKKKKNCLPKTEIPRWLSDNKPADEIFNVISVFSRFGPTHESFFFHLLP